MFKKLKASEIPGRERKAGFSKFECTDEWKAMSREIAKGLKPGAALQVSLSAEDMKRIGLKNNRAVPRFIQKHLKEAGKPYKVSTLRRDGMEHVFVTAE